MSGAAAARSALLLVADPGRGHDELDPLLARLAIRVLVLADVLLGQAVDVIVGVLAGPLGPALDLDVLVRVVRRVDKQGDLGVALEVRRTPPTDGAVHPPVTILS